MTRQEFIDDVTSWSELIDFCYDQDCDICEDIYSEEAKDDHFNNDLVEMARNANDWEELLETLNDIPTGYDYYICNEYDEFRGQMTMILTHTKTMFSNGWMMENTGMNMTRKKNPKSILTQKMKCLLKKRMYHLLSCSLLAAVRFKNLKVIKLRMQPLLNKKKQLLSMNYAYRSVLQ